jgi:hypothetical protein
MMAYGLVCMPMLLTTPIAAQSVADNGPLPVLYGIRLENAQVLFDVVSSGCTTASYFSVRLEPVSAGSYRLSIEQNRRDRCRMSAHVITLALDLPARPDLSEATFELMNQLKAPVALLRSDP